MNGFSHSMRCTGEEAQNNTIGWETLAENMADAGGRLASYRAFRKFKQRDLTLDKNNKFFIKTTQVFCAKPDLALDIYRAI